jgi:uncharacterized membrane protein YccF (DUF307 family)
MEWIDKITVWGNREPILTIRRILWLITAGWVLFLFYIFAALGMLITIVFAPFSIQTFQMAVFALDGGITREPYSPKDDSSTLKHIWTDPTHPFTIAANVVWAVFFGWGFALLHLFLAIIQFLTIIGIGTAITQFKLLSFVIWPFGRSLRHKWLPTTLEELHHGKDTRRPDFSYIEALERGEEHTGKSRVYGVAAS